MNEELKIIIKAVTDGAKKGIEGVRKELEGVQKGSGKAGASFGAAVKGIVKGAAVAVAAISAVGAALIALGKNSLEYNQAQAKLITAFQAVGLSAEQAAESYSGLYRFLGDTDKAVEAAAHLAKLTQNEKYLAEWATIAQGVYATFGDSISTEALTESANETARVGKLTGALTDALNWAGVSEDAFNAKLAETSSLEEREAVIRKTLNGLYSNAAELYERNNRAILEHNEAQAEFQQKCAAAGATVTPLITALYQMGSAIMTALKPALETILPWIAGFVMWVTEAINRVAAFAGLLSGASDSVTSVGEGVAKATQKASGGVNTVNQGLKDMKKNAEAARKAALGFDELNIVPNPNSSSSAIAGGTGALEGIDMSGLTGNIESLTGNLEDFKAKAEEAKNAISQWMEEWGWVLATIAGILSALSIKHLIVQMASLVGLGEAASKALSFTGAAAGIKKLIGWLGAVIGLMKEGNSFWAVMGAAFPKVAAAFKAIGTAIAGAAKAVGAFIGGLSAGAIAIIVAIVLAVASAVYFLWKNWDAVCEKVKEFCELNIAPIFEEFKKSFSQLWEAIKSIGQAFADLGKLIWDALPDGFKQWMEDAAAAIWGVIKAIGEWFASIDWLEAIGTVFEWLGGIVVGIVGGVIAGAIQGVLNLLESAVQIITGIVQVIAGVVSGLVNLIVALFTGDFSKALDSVIMIWEGIKNVFKGAADAVIGTVWGFIEGIIDFFVHMWDVLVGHSIVPDTIEAIIEWFAYLPIKVFEIVAGFVKGVIDFVADLAAQIGEWAVTIWNNIKAPFTAVGSWFANIFSGAWNGIKNAWSSAGSWFGSVWSNIKSAFGNVSDWFKNTFSSAWTAVKNVFSTGGKIFDGIKDGILNGLKTIVNGIITGINKVIAVPFNGLNSALKTIKNIEIVGIKPFSWISTLSVPQIPKLAKGGVVDEATLALIGEKGREAVVPLENNTEWMDRFIDKLLARSNGQATIILQVGETELGRAAARGINNITRQTGTIPLLV